MQNDTKSNSTDYKQHSAQWHLDLWHAVNAQTTERVYVRELLDIGSYEFSCSKLTAVQRLDIISKTGEDAIFQVMKEISNEKAREYLQENFNHDMAILQILADRDAKR